MEVHELISKLQEYDSDIQVLFEHDLTLHERKLDDIEVFEFGKIHILVI